MNVGITPTQFQAIERRKAFHAKINAMAARQSTPPQRAIGIKGYQVPTMPRPVELPSPLVKALPPAAYPAEPDPPIVYPVIYPVVRHRTTVKRPRSSVRTIQMIVSKRFNISITCINSAVRTKNFIVPRHVAMFLTHGLTTFSLPAIGRMFGGRDHTTILNAIRKTKQRMAADPDFASKVEALRAECLHAISVPAEIEEIGGRE